MQIELYIDGEKKVFTAPFVPMLAKRKYLEIEAKAEERLEEEKKKGNENYVPSAKEQLEEENELLGILCDVVFQGQFTIEQLVNGASDEYVYSKLREAVFGEKPKNEEVDQGNEEER